MKPSDELFELIKSLNKSEKRYFHLFAAKNDPGKDKNYLKLFNEISIMDEYDEPALKDIFKGEKFIKQLHVTKNYLYKMIMKSLSAVYSEKSQKLFVKELIQNAGILYDKLLYKQAEKLLHKAKKTALKHEMYEQVLEINQTLIMINTHATGHKKDFKSEIGPFINEQARLIKQLEELHKSHFSYLEMSYFHKRTMYLRDKKYKTIADKIFSKQKRQPINSIRTAPYTFGLGFLYYVYISDDKSAYKICMEYIRFLEKTPEYIKENPQLYIRALQAGSIVTRDLGKFREQHELLEKLKKLHNNSSIPLSSRIKNLLRDTIDETEMFLHMETFEFEKALNHIKEFEIRIKQSENKLPVYKRGVYYYTFGYVYFLSVKYKESLYWLNKLIVIEEKSSIENAYLLSMLLSCIVHFEKGDYELVLSRIGSISRHISQNKLCKRFETTSIEYIAKIIKLGYDKNRDELKKAYTDFRKALTEIAKDENERAAMSMLDLISWVDSKTKGISITEAIKKNNSSLN
jgi:hypothetical protein